jgi:hypothetical protein
MRRELLIFLFLVNLLSCQQVGHHARFEFARVTFVAYHWSNPRFLSQEIFRRPICSFAVADVDSPYAIVFDKVVEVDSEGRCTVGYADSMGRPLVYSNAILPRSVDHILQDINSCSLDTVYRSPHGPDLYDGPSFCLLIEPLDHRRMLVTYPFDYQPPPLDSLHFLLSGIKQLGNRDKLAPFNLQDIANMLGIRDADQINRLVGNQIRTRPIAIPDREEHRQHIRPSKRLHLGRPKPSRDSTANCP